jgi:hypothetical protein
LRVEAALPPLEKQISEIDNKLKVVISSLINIENNLSNYSKNIN